ncbi:MAG: LysM peptidoglycan-binding domain-containing M23 family metallopeptidase [Marinibacterium sp.]|nr:LysM peptidoglycan-binding domain-containing M23 family metallopeptidase [Marinibacterium sp.]
MQFSPIYRAVALSSLALLAACDQPIDLDVRDQLGGFSTADAARAASAARPEPDARGVITYPNYQVAVARNGDTVQSIAARLGLNAASLARFNGIDADSPLRAGEVIALPKKVPTADEVDIAALAEDAIDSAPNPGGVAVTPLAPAATAKPDAAAKPTTKPAAKPTGPEPIRHKVKRGETAYTIARLYDVPVQTVAEWNGLGPDFAVREGQQLLIPRTGSASASSAAASPTAPGAGSPTPTPPSATTPLPANDVEPGAAAASTAAASAAAVGAAGSTTKASAGAMAYPVQGKIIRDYAKGRNEGIDISAAPGTPVGAAESGTVAAITTDADKVPIVVVRHPDNLLTVYANVDKITVSKGDSVKRGQKIGQLRSGPDAYVHFEVRKGFESVDPTQYLK